MLSVKPFNLARLPRGIRGKAEYPFKDGFSVDIKTYTGDSPELLVSHYTNDGRDDLIEYAIPLLWTVPPFGGLRWWFLCPATRRRCCKLYLPNGGRRFLSRQAYRLRYACKSRRDSLGSNANAGRSIGRSAAMVTMIGCRIVRQACGSEPMTG